MCITPEFSGSCWNDVFKNAEMKQPSGIAKLNFNFGNDGRKPFDIGALLEAANDKLSQGNLQSRDITKLQIGIEKLSTILQKNESIFTQLKPLILNNIKLSQSLLYEAQLREKRANAMAFSQTDERSSLAFSGRVWSEIFSCCALEDAPPVISFKYNDVKIPINAHKLLDAVLARYGSGDLTLEQLNSIQNGLIKIQPAHQTNEAYQNKLKLALDCNQRLRELNANEVPDNDQMTDPIRRPSQSPPKKRRKIGFENDLSLDQAHPYDLAAIQALHRCKDICLHLDTITDLKAQAYQVLIDSHCFPSEELHGYAYLLDYAANQTPNLQKNYAGNDPTELERNGRILLELYGSSEGNVDYYLQWGVKFLEKAADMYTKSNDIKALELRLELSESDIIGSNNTLSQMNTLLETPIKIKHLILGEINDGICFNPIDGQKIKGENLKVKHISVDGNEQKSISFKTSYWAADNVRTALLQLQRPECAEMLISRNFCSNVTVESGSHYYYPQENGSFTTTSTANTTTSISRPWGAAINVTLEGLAAIQIGADKTYGSLYNKVNITMDPRATPQDLQKVLSIMGLTSAVTNATDEDQKRLKINTLIHFFYPRLVADLERTREYHETPIDDLLEELDQLQPGLKQKVLEHLDQLEIHSLSSGESRFKLQGLDLEIEKLGGRGFISGIGGSSFSNAATNLACIMQTGFLASQVRFENGLLLGGDSARDDHKRNGADSIYARAVTQNCIDQNFNIAKVDLSGWINVTLHNRAVNLMPYFHTRDYYGCRNPDDEDYGWCYRSRPNMEEHYKANQSNWVLNNEVMFKSRLDPEYITGITYRDPRRVLVQQISDKNATFFPSELITSEEKMEYITAHAQLVSEELASYEGYLILKGAPTYEGRSIAEHWVVNPRQTIKNELARVGIIDEINGKEIDDFIQEKEILDADMFKSCHSQLGELQ